MRSRTLARVAPPGRRSLLAQLTAIVGFAVVVGAGEVQAASEKRSIAEANASRFVPELARSAKWRALLHFAGDDPTSSQSSVLSREFFLAPQGNVDPEAELRATVKLLYADESDADELRCRFLHRTRWLARELQHLGVDVELPQICAAAAEWMARVGRGSVHLVFAEAYLGHPGSMLGHTFLRFDAADRAILHSLSVNYAARSDDDPLPVLVWKGLSGGYVGAFALRPYVQLVRAYAGWEQRDLWEFELDLTAPEIDALVEHLWELQDATFAYRFVRENCAYQILALLHVVRPERNLLGRFQTFALPQDTIFELEKSGLVRRTRWRKSLATLVHQHAMEMSLPERRAVARLAAGELDPGQFIEVAPDETRIGEVLEAAYDLSRFEILTRRASPVEKQASRRIVAALATVDSRQPMISDTAETESPLHGHAARRFVSRLGMRGDRPFAEVGLRFGFHASSDPQQGYPPGIELRLLDLTLRGYVDPGSVHLQELTFLDVGASRTATGGRLSAAWRVYTQLATMRIPTTHTQSTERELDDRIVWRTAPFFGLAYDAPRWTISAGGRALMDVSHSLHEEHAIGLGPLMVGEVEVVRDRWSVGAEGSFTRFVAGERRSRWDGRLFQRVTLSRANCVTLEFEPVREFGSEWNEYRLGWQHYF